MKMKLILTYCLLFFSTSIRSQELLMLYPPFTNGIINTGDTLDALIQLGEFYELRPTKITLDSFYNPAWDEMQTVYKYQIDEGPIIFFKNHKFKKREIIGENKNSLFIKLDTSITYLLDSNLYVFQSKGIVEDHDSCQIIKDYEITIKTIENQIESTYSLIKVPRVQISSNWFIEAPKLIWIGDLDNDNKLDIILSEACHYAEIKVGIYLSLERVGNKYVKKTGVHGSVD